MSESNNQNAYDPAHPAQELIGHTENGPQFRYWPGLTKLEEFAKAAMQGMLSRHGYYGDEEILALKSIKCAKALLAELDKPTKSNDQSHE